jgi:hypothetical protein
MNAKICPSLLNFKFEKRLNVLTEMPPEGLGRKGYPI